MKAPRFWQNAPEQPGLWARILGPLGMLYAFATARRIASTKGYRASVPVICIGNINIGGTGKTPTVIALVERFKSQKIDAHVVSRGFGGTLSGPVQVQEGLHTAKDVGDEPLLLSAFTTTWIAKDRALGVRAAEKAGAQIIILDDGFQNPSVQKSLSIVVVDANHGFGNGRALPAGPLRETVKAGLARADFVLSIGNASAQDLFSKRWENSISCPHIRGVLAPLSTGMDWAAMDVLAFAGIGHPEKFFATLRGLGANVVRAEALDDHQPLTQPLLARLENESHSLNAQLVTTEKDAVRLPDSFRQKVLTVPVRLEISDWSRIDLALKRLNPTP